MKPATSLYLDLVRFTAAVSVLFYHASLQRFTGGFFWQAHLYGETAVVVFFVLSGFVIAHVLATRENTPLVYAASRFARLYSVIIPALILTAVCNTIGSLNDPELYRSGFSYLNGEPLARYPATLLLVNRWWLATLEPNANQPFWSLSFEAAYYVAIGLIVFTKGIPRLVAVGSWAAIVGPTIVIMAPLWFAGYGVYHLCARIRIAPAAAVALWFVSGLLLLLCWRLEPLGFAITLPYVQRDTLVSDYAAAFCFAANLIAFSSLSSLVEGFVSQFGRFIRWLGSLTFALYLVHFPLLQFLTAYRVGPPSSWAQRMWIIGVIALIVVLLAPVCERAKHGCKRMFVLSVSAVQSFGVTSAAFLNRASGQ